jgi:hypothetical protein
MGEYFEILAARVDPGRIRKRQRRRKRVRNDNEKVDPIERFDGGTCDPVRSTLTHTLRIRFGGSRSPRVPAYSPISISEEPSGGSQAAPIRLPALRDDFLHCEADRQKLAVGVLCAGDH